MQSASSRLRRQMRENPNYLGRVRRRRRRSTASQGNDLLGLNGGSGGGAGGGEVGSTMRGSSVRKKKKKKYKSRSRAQGYAKDPLYRAALLRRRRMLQESENITPTTQRTLDYFTAVLERQEAVKRVNKERRYTDERCIIRTTHPEAPNLHVCIVMLTCRGAERFNVAKISEYCARMPLRHSIKQPRMGYMRIMDFSVNVTGTGSLVFFCRNVYAAHMAIRYASLTLNQHGVLCAPRDIEIKHIMATMNVGFMVDIMAMARMHRGKVSFNLRGRTATYRPDIPLNAEKRPFSARFYLRGSIVIVGAKTHAALCQAQKILWTLAKKFRMDDETKEVIRQEGETAYYTDKLSRTPISFEELMQAATHRQRELTGSHTVSITHAQSVPPSSSSSSSAPAALTNNDSPSPSSPPPPSESATALVAATEDEKSVFNIDASDSETDSDEGLEIALQQGAAHMIEKTAATLARLNRVPKKRAARKKADSVITISNTRQSVAPLPNPVTRHSASATEEHVKRLKLMTSATLPVAEKTKMHNLTDVSSAQSNVSLSTLVLRPGEASTREVRPEGLNRAAIEASSSALTDQDLVVASKVGAGFGGLPTFSVQKTTKITRTPALPRPSSPSLDTPKPPDPPRDAQSSVTQESFTTYWTRPSIPSATIPYASNDFVGNLSTALNAFTSAVLPSVLTPTGGSSTRRGAGAPDGSNFGNGTSTHPLHIRNANPP